MRRFNSILIVEDDREIREALRDVITLEGYQAVEAENGKVALDLLRQGGIAKEPCLILLDLMMPELNGWEFLELRRKSDAIAAIPTIVLSAVSDSKLPKGAVKILRKPVNLISLLEEIEGYCTPTAA